MKNVFKPVLLTAMAAALAISSGCSGDTKWSFKSGDFSLTNGNWIYNSYESTRSAVAKIQEEDSEATIDNIDFDKKEIEGKAAKDWIYSDAKKSCLRQLTLDNLAKKYKVKADETELESVKKMYISYYYSESKDLFEKLGVSEDSFVEAAIKPSYTSQAIFNAIYGKGGEKEVGDEELNKFFKENYVTYYYIGYSMKTTDENGESQNIDDDTKDKVETSFKKYANMLNKQSKTTDDVDNEYKNDFSVEQSAGASETVMLDNMEDEDLKKAVTDAKEKEAVVVDINDTKYLIYKGNINDKVKDIKYNEDIKEEDKGAVSRDSIVSNMKSEEYQDFLDEEQSKLEYTRNDACIAKYSVMRTVDIYKKYLQG